MKKIEDLKKANTNKPTLHFLIWKELSIFRVEYKKKKKTERSINGLCSLYNSHSGLRYQSGRGNFPIKPRPKMGGTKKKKKKKTTTQQSVYRFQTFFFLYICPF